MIATKKEGSVLRRTCRRTASPFLEKGFLSKPHLQPGREASVFFHCVGVFWFHCSRWLDSIVLWGTGGGGDGQGGLKSLICGAVRAFRFPELCVNCWRPSGTMWAMRTWGWPESWSEKKPSFSRAWTLSSCAPSSPGPRKHLAETSPPHTPWDEAGMKWIWQAQWKPLGLCSVLQGIQEL